MDKTLLINLIWAAVCAIIGIVAQFISAYLKAKGVVTEEAAHQIAVAEEAFSTVEHAGKQKMELCIDALYGLIPAQVRIFFTREMIGQIVQKVFDEVEKYKNVWIESSAEKLAQKLEEEQLFPYYFLEGKRVKTMCWNGKTWVKCDRNGKPI